MGGATARFFGETGAMMARGAMTPPMMGPMGPMGLMGGGMGGPPAMGFMGGGMGRMGGMGMMAGGMGRMGGMGGMGMLGMAGKGMRMSNPVGWGMMAAGMASTAVADSMAARGVEMPEPGALAQGAGALTGFDPRLIQMGIDFLKTVPALLSQAWAAITAVVTPWAEAFAGFMRGIVSGAQMVWNGLVTFFTTTLPGAFSAAWGVVTGVFTTMGGILGSVVTGVVEAVKAVFNGLVEYYTVFLPGMFMQGVEAITGVFGTLVSFFTDTLPAAFTALGQRVTEFKDNLVLLATEAVDRVKGVFEGLRTFVTVTLPQGFENFVGALGGWKDRVVGIAGSVARSFVEGISGIPNFFLNTLPNMLRNGARGVINALIDGLIAAAERIPGVGSLIAGKLADYLKGNSPPKLGPLKDIIVGGANIIAAWGEGLAGGTGTAVRAALGVARSVWNVFTNRKAPPVPVPVPAPAGAAMSGAGAALAGAQQPEAPREPALGTQMLGMVTEKFGGLVASLGPLGMVATLLEGVFQGLAPLIDSLKEPLRIVGEILGRALSPILKALFPVFKVVAIAATYIGQVFFTVAGGIARAIGSVIKALGTAIDKVPFLGDFGLKKFGQGMIDTGKEFGQSAKDLEEGREEIQKLKFGETAEAAEKANEAMRNVPEGFKIALARFQVAAPTPVASPTGIGTVSAPVTPTGAPAPVENNPVTIQQVHIVSDNPEKIWHQLRDVMEREGLRHNGNPMAYAMV